MGCLARGGILRGPVVDRARGFKMVLADSVGCTVGMCAYQVWPLEAGVAKTCISPKDKKNRKALYDMAEISKRVQMD